MKRWEYIEILILVALSFIFVVLPILLTFSGSSGTDDKWDKWDR